MSIRSTPTPAPKTTRNTHSTSTSSSSRSIADYERSILSHLRDATKPWLSISKDFLDAKSHLTHPEFKELCKKVGLSYSTARKLIKVAECTRLSNYADRLASIDAWSTLHEIAKLDASSFGEFAAEYLNTANDVRVFKRSDVEKFNANRNGAPAPFTSYFTVKVNASAALSKSEEDTLFAAAESLEQSLAGKIKLVWHVDKPASTSASPAMLAA